MEHSGHEPVGTASGLHPDMTQFDPAVTYHIWGGRRVADDPCKIAAVGSTPILSTIIAAASGTIGAFQASEPGSSPGSRSIMMIRKRRRR